MPVGEEGGGEGGGGADVSVPAEPAWDVEGAAPEGGGGAPADASETPEAAAFAGGGGGEGGAADAPVGNAPALEEDGAAAWLGPPDEAFCHGVELRRLTVELGSLLAALARTDAVASSTAASRSLSTVGADS